MGNGAIALAGRVVAAGKQSCARLSDLLNLGADERVEVHAVAWVDHALEVEIGLQDVGSWTLRIEQRVAESKGLILTGKLNAYFRGNVDPVLAALLVKRASSRLDLLDMSSLADALAGDPDLGAPGQRFPPSADSLERPQSLLNTWGGSDAYADFFANGEIARSQLDSIDPSRLFRFVQHCDAECLQVNPHAIVPIVSLVNFPWDDRKRVGAVRPGFEVGTLDQETLDDGMVTTDLDENDVIFGSRPKLERVLQYAVTRISADNRPLFFSNTCVPAVIGEDVESTVTRVAEHSGKRILYLTVSARSMVTVFREFFVDYRLQIEREATAPDVNAVNLIGFARGTATEELIAELAELGVRVNVCFLPEVRVETLMQLPRASLSILYPNSAWQHHYDQLTFQSRTPSLVLDAPYGMAASAEWVDAIAAALGRSQHSGALDAEAGGEWESLRGKAARHTLGVVVRDQEAFHLTTPSRNWGIPLLRVLEEMGFRLEILVGVSNKRVANRAAREIRAAFDDQTRHSVFAFDGFPLLMRRMHDSPASAYFSYHFFDWRITSAGKAVFSLQQFEMGRRGAIRSLKRLLRVCETSYYRRYSKFLHRRASGLRNQEFGK